MSRTMYDSTNPYNIPNTAEMVAGYDDGTYVWNCAEWGLFPSATKVHIATSPTTLGSQVLDVEHFDATPTDALPWAKLKRARGEIPTVYCNVATWPQVVTVFHNANEALPLWWAAKWDNEPDILPFPAIAKQYQSFPTYDVSVVPGNWPGVDTLTKDPTMPKLLNNPVDACLCPTGGSWVVGSDGGVGNYQGAPFHGSYPGLPAAEREGNRTFLSIEPCGQGYAIIADDGSVYRFGV